MASNRSKGVGPPASAPSPDELRAALTHGIPPRSADPEQLVGEEWRELVPRYGRCSRCGTRYACLLTFDRPGAFRAGLARPAHVELEVARLKKALGTRRVDLCHVCIYDLGGTTAQPNLDYVAETVEVAGAPEQLRIEIPTD